MFEIGYRIKNLRTKGTNAGQYGVVTDIDIDGENVYVRYDNGNTGSSNEPGRYYEIVSKTSRTSTANNTKTKTPMKNVLATVKRMLMSDDQKALIDSGLKSECGEYSQDALAVLAQEYAASKEARLIEIANGILEERKAQKEANK